jgi:phosphoserine phosphatase RsbU/P
VSADCPIVVPDRPDGEFHGGIRADIRDARILIVDGSVLFRNVIAGQLRGAGFTNVGLARDGLEALEAIHVSLPELVITDLVMPNMDGFALCRWMRSDPVTRDIPILVESNIESDDRARVFSAGATDLIGKPIDLGELLGRVRVHLERRRLIERLSEFQRHMRQELDQARAMQESLLPTAQDLRRLEARFPVALASHYMPSSGLGGDIWGIEAIDPHRLKVFSLDFSGHGVGAALNTFRMHSFVSSGPSQRQAAGAWLEQLNRFLCDVLPLGQFATMFCGIVDFSAGTLTYASAASPSPLVMSAGAGEGFQPIDGTGYPLGLERHASYEDRTVAFPPGSALFLYSDALVETPDLAKPIFTAETLAAFLNELAYDTTPQRAQEAVLQRLYAGALHNLADDLTLVSLNHLEQSNG